LNGSVLAGTEQDVSQVVYIYQAESGGHDEHGCHHDGSDESSRP
jgi:hypothetical protein